MTQTQTTTGDVIDEILELFRTRGGGDYGESISQTQHALQSAWCAEKQGARPAMIAAALLHDIGHLLAAENDHLADRGIDDRHEAIGAAFLSRHFVTDVVAAVSLHVQAKRILVTSEPGYKDTLSAASILSLALQGGPASADEVASFKRKIAANDALALRRWDDEAKIVGLNTPDLAHFRHYLEAARKA
jgi:[1-hydroxy-2-(trimethylamino)ethyl]phosphonate dioxygenase